jgi:hypothetical protein
MQPRSRMMGGHSNEPLPVRTGFLGWLEQAPAR